MPHYYPNEDELKERDEQRTQSPHDLIEHCMYLEDEGFHRVFFDSGEDFADAIYLFEGYTWTFHVSRSCYHASTE